MLAAMRTRLALFLLTLTTLAPLSPSVDAADQPKRVKRTCAQMREDLESVWKRMKTPGKVTPGSWGDLPAPLRKLPAGAELCGVGKDGQVIIVSPAAGKDLETHYAPLFAEIGCKPFKCSTGPMTNCSCSGPGAAAGTVLTDTGAETYALMYMQLKK
jgi:hypothetical protein